MSCLRLQKPLEEASRNGHTEIVAMLLKVEGIDVNKGVSVMTAISTKSWPFSLYNYQPLPLVVIFPSFSLFLGTPLLGLKVWLHRHSGVVVVTGRWN